jgi:hypothetical protein
MRVVLAVVCLALGTPSALAELADADLIAKFKATWRAQDGASPDEIISQTERVARFVPRGWKVQRRGGDPLIEFSWAKRARDEPGQEYTIDWVAKIDGTFESTQSFKVVDLGWQALALSLIGDDVANRVRSANVRFLLDPRNYNFITTPRGKIGDILVSSRCALNAPVDVSYHSAGNGKLGRFSIQASVDCRASDLSPRAGEIIMEKAGSGPWAPQSFFTKQFYRQ